MGSCNMTSSASNDSALSHRDCPLVLRLTAPAKTLTLRAESSGSGGAGHPCLARAPAAFLSSCHQCLISSPKTPAEWSSELQPCSVAKSFRLCVFNRQFPKGNVFRGTDYLHTCNQVLKSLVSLSSCDSLIFLRLFSSTVK